MKTPERNCLTCIRYKDGIRGPVGPLCKACDKESNEYWKEQERAGKEVDFTAERYGIHWVKKPNGSPARKKPRPNLRKSTAKYTKGRELTALEAIDRILIGETIFWREKAQNASWNQNLSVRTIKEAALLGYLFDAIKAETKGRTGK